jgi:hypothetical protein
MKAGFTNTARHHNHHRSIGTMFVTVVFASLALPAAAQMPSIRFIEPDHARPSTNVAAISGNGSTVVGVSCGPLNIPFYWTPTDGRVSVVPPSGFNYAGLPDVSRDGSIFAGLLSSTVGAVPPQIARYRRATGWEVIPGVAGYKYMTVNTMSGDGQSMAGGAAPSFQRLGETRSYIWSATTGYTFIPSLGNNDGVAVAGLNYDGTVAVGTENEQAWRWTPSTGTVQLPSLSGPRDIGPYARAVSSDGQWVVGDTFAPGGRINMVRWDKNNTIQDLGNVLGASASAAFAVSDDGNLVAGTSSGTFGEAATFWTPTLGMQRLDQYLLNRGVTLPTGVQLIEIKDVSGDGNVMVGAAIFPDSFYRAFVVTIPTPTTLPVCLLAASLLSPRRRRPS